MDPWLVSIQDVGRFMAVAHASDQDSSVAGYT